jgi:hypothetical protein
MSNIILVILFALFFKPFIAPAEITAPAAILLVIAFLIAVGSDVIRGCAAINRLDNEGR